MSFKESERVIVRECLFVGVRLGELVRERVRFVELKLRVGAGLVFKSSL